MTGPDELATEHARFEFDDAAYLLGALDAGQRQAFERHLEHWFPDPAHI